jgi:uncharacterized cupin superfamily protein
VNEAPLEETEHGLVAAGEGWFVLNARDARWRERPGMGYSMRLEGETEFPQVGIHIIVLGPGEPMAMYHREADQEDFLVLNGEGLLIVEGQERPLRQWDFVHCPVGTSHVIIGGPCAVLCIGAREHQDDDWGAYTVDEAAIRHGAGVEQETTDENVAYAHVPETKPTRYRDGWL